LKGWGFINHEEGDVFFHQKDVVDGSVCDRGDTVSYEVVYIVVRYDVCDHLLVFLAI
jgi:hypothetical protein